jgi:hypothetical protein
MVEKGILLSPVQDAFSCMLDEARDQHVLYGEPAYRGLVRLITLHGKLPFHYGLASLTHYEAKLVMMLMGREDIRIYSANDVNYARCNIFIAHSSFGKITFFPNDELLEKDPTIIGGLLIDKNILDYIEDECIVHQVMEQKERREADALLQEWERAGVLPCKVEQTMDWVERVESVYIYIDGQLFSRSDAGGNTLNTRPDGILRKLREKPLVQWTEQEKLFIIGSHCLFLTGRAIRFEEFNSRQLSLQELRRWLISRYCVYSRAVGKDIESDLLGMALIPLAEQVGSLALEVDRSGWMRVRRINGITFVKQEYLLPPDAVTHDTIALPGTLLRLEEELGIARESDPLVSVEALTRKAFQHFRMTGSSQYMHRLIEAIVFSAVVDAGADYGMSSSLRIPGRLKRTDQQRIAGVLSLTKHDFYCCVLPHPSMVNLLSAEEVNRILYASALRMEFNRWHFIPGNYPREEIPANRHYYFPPMMPDIAEWSDLRHGGHFKASVRYSIRVPGASLWKEPFVAFGHPYRGCYDIRLVRMEGPAFGRHELQIAARHCNILDAFWRTLQKCIEKYEITEPIITAYTRDWYETFQWKEAIQTWITD